MRVQTMGGGDPEQWAEAAKETARTTWNTRYIAGADGVDIDAIHRKHDPHP